MCAIGPSKMTTTARRRSTVPRLVRKKVKRTMKSKQNAESLLKLSRCKDIVNDWEDWSAAGFSWWQPVFDLLDDPNDEVVKVRFTHIQARHVLKKLLQRRGS
jgi:hypothetical protein